MSKNSGMSKWLFLVMCAFVAVLPGVCNAVTFTWFGGTGAWENGANWDQGGSIPGESDQANFVTGTCTISSTQKCFVSIIGFGISTTTLDIQAGGSLTQAVTEMIIGIAGGGPTAPSVVNVEGIATLASLRIGGEGTNNYGIMNINGGSVTVTSFGTYLGTRWDNTNTGIATVNISNGGTFTIDGMGALGNRIDIKDGSHVNLLDSTSTFKVKDDYTTYLQGLVNAGKITGNNSPRCFLAVSFHDGYTYVQEGSCICATFPPEDMNHDCYVDFHDFAFFAQGWLSCTNPIDANCL
jgi:hypothetical protein